MKWSEQTIVETDSITINDAKFNVLHICLMLESVGLFSLELRKHFQSYLQRSLHRLLEKAGTYNVTFFIY